MDNSASIENDFEPVDIELEQNFKSDFARSLSEKKKVHPEIRLNSTRISADLNEDEANTLTSEKNAGGEDDVFLAETQELNPQGAESLIERALNRKSMPKELGRLFNKDFSTDDAPAEEQVNSSIEKTLATKNQQERGEIERSRKSTSNPIKVSDLAGRFEKKQSSSERLEIPRETGTKKKKKRVCRLIVFTVRSRRNHLLEHVRVVKRLKKRMRREKTRLPRELIYHYSIPRKENVM